MHQILILIIMRALHLIYMYVKEIWTLINGNEWNLGERGLLGEVDVLYCALHPGIGGHGSTTHEPKQRQKNHCSRVRSKHLSSMAVATDSCRRLLRGPSSIVGGVESSPYRRTLFCWVAYNDVRRTCIINIHSHVGMCPHQQKRTSTAAILCVGA